MSARDLFFVQSPLPPHNYERMTNPAPSEYGCMTARIEHSRAPVSACIDRDDVPNPVDSPDFRHAPWEPDPGIDTLD